MKQVFVKETEDSADGISRLDEINEDLFQREIPLQRSQRSQRIHMSEL